MIKPTSTLDRTPPSATSTAAPTPDQEEVKQKITTKKNVLAGLGLHRKGRG